MQVKVRKVSKDGMVRLETSGEIKEVIINEDFLNPNNETIAVCFRGDTSSGIIDFTPNELNKLMNTVKKRMHLIKGMKTITTQA